MRLPNISASNGIRSIDGLTTGKCLVIRLGGSGSSTRKRWMNGSGVEVLITKAIKDIRTVGNGKYYHVRKRKYRTQAKAQRSLLIGRCGVVL